MEEKIPVWCKGEEWCALKSTSKILGRKWVPVIIFHLEENEELRFNQLKKEVGGITNKTLSENLDRLEDQGIVSRDVEESKPVIIKYSLTDFGERLVPIIEEMINWGRDNLREGDKQESWVK